MPPRRSSTGKGKGRGSHGEKFSRRGRGATQGRSIARDESSPSSHNASREESPLFVEEGQEEQEQEQEQLTVTGSRRLQPPPPVENPFLRTMLAQNSSAISRSPVRAQPPGRPRQPLRHITVPLPRVAVRQISRREMRPEGWQPLTARMRAAHPPDSYRVHGTVYSPGDEDYIPLEGRDREEEEQRVVLETPEEREAERVRLIRQHTHRIYAEERSTISRLSALPTEEVYPHEPAITHVQEEYRIETLRDMVRLPHMINRDTLIGVLSDTNWDVIEAAARLRRRDRNARIIDPYAPLFPGLPRYTERPRGASLNRGHGGTPVQTSRRAVLAALLVRLGHQPNAPLPHENTTIIAFLHAHHWDLEEAVEAYHVNGGNLDAYRRHGEHLRSRNPTQYQQDQRLAEFLSWVSIDSVHSAREHLKRHKWDVARAADEWVRLGYVPILRPSAARDRHSIYPMASQGMRSVSVEYGPDNDNLYRHDDTILDSESYDFEGQTRNPDPNPAWARTLTPQPENSQNPPEYSDKRDANSRHVTRQGFVIDENRRPPRVHCPNPTKLRDEAIHRGEYRTDWHVPGFDYRGKSKLVCRWYDSDSNDDDNNKKAEPNPHAGRPEFDWRKTVGHVKRLTQDRATFFLRETMQPMREAIVPYHELELQWLWEATSRQVERFAQTNNLGVLEEGRGLPPAFPAAVRAAWEADFNLRFQGQTVVDGVQLNQRPRPWRSGRSLVVQLGRMDNVVEDFLVTRNQSYIPTGSELRGRRGKRRRVAVAQPASREGDEGERVDSDDEGEMTDSVEESEEWPEFESDEDEEDDAGDEDEDYVDE